MSIPNVRELIEAGVHFGHRASRWHPKMAQYIFGKNKLIHIIDLKATLRGVVMAQRLLTSVTAAGEEVLLVGTKRQARPIIRKVAADCEMPFVAERWLGGTLTNFRTIRSRLTRLVELETMAEDGTFDKMSKKQVSVLNRQMGKLQKNLEGIREMKRIPAVMIVVDPRKENIAVLEARKLNIPVVALLDTDCNPDNIDICIPGNDDALRSIEVIFESLCRALQQGKAKRMGGGLEQIPATPVKAPPAPEAIQGQAVEVEASVATAIEPAQSEQTD